MLANGTHLPFERSADRLYVLQAASAINHAPESAAIALAAVAHKRKAHAHVDRSTADSAARELHARTHMSTTVIKSMIGSTTDAPEVLKNATDVDCPHCKTANARSAPHSGTIEPAASRPGSRIHCDLTGKLRKSIMGYNYLIVFVCEHTRYIFGYLLRTRDELDITVKRFFADFRAAARSVDKRESMPNTLRANLDVEGIRSDNAGELTSHTYHELLDDQSTRFEYTPAYTKDPNGIAERYIGMIFRLVRSMLHAASAPLSFWDTCALNAIDVLNRVLHITTNSTADPSKTAHELLTMTKPSIMEIVPFGCAAYVARPDPQVEDSTLSVRGWRGMVCGRSSNTIGAYRVWLPTQGRFAVTSDLEINTSDYPWRKEAAPGTQQSATPPSPPPTNATPPSPPQEKLANTPPPGERPLHRHPKESMSPTSSRAHTNAPTDCLPTSSSSASTAQTTTTANIVTSWRADGATTS